MSNSPAKLFPVGLAMQGAKGLYQAAQGIIGSRGRKREEREAKADYQRMKEKILSQDTSNPYANLENTFEDMTVNQQQAEFTAQQQSQQQANIMSSMAGAAGGSGIAALAQAMANQGSANLQQAGASIGAQEAGQQMAKARAAGRNQELMAKGEMMSREMQMKQDATEFGWAGNRVAEAEAARAQAKANLEQGITTTAEVGLKAGNIFGKSTKPGGFGGGGTDGLGGGQQMYPTKFGPGGITIPQIKDQQQWNQQVQQIGGASQYMYPQGN